MIKSYYLIQEQVLRSKCLQMKMLITDQWVVVSLDMCKMCIEMSDKCIEKCKSVSKYVEIVLGFYLFWNYLHPN